MKMSKFFGKGRIEGKNRPEFFLTKKCWQHGK
jgi:hypothetical protein